MINSRRLKGFFKPWNFLNLESLLIKYHKFMFKTINKKYLGLVNALKKNHKLE